MKYDSKGKDILVCSIAHPALDILLNRVLVQTTIIMWKICEFISLIRSSAIVKSYLFTSS